MENPQTPARILVVDDEPDIRNILHILLSSRGYAVDEAENGLRAVACVRAQPDYDLIITGPYTHLRAHETKANLVCRRLLEKKKQPVCSHLLEKKKKNL